LPERQECFFRKKLQYSLGVLRNSGRALILIDFSIINGFNKGPHDSFEDLICILAKREYPKNGIEFQPNEGRGGDGGVEAIWLLSDGKKIGYQAKYFLSMSDVQWRQMDESVKQAISIHPELTRYVFALPKDLTPERGGRGKSEWEKWTERVNNWKSWAALKSINIEFDLWSETSLKEMLLRDTNTALVKYWFGRDLLDNNWFDSQVALASQTLDDRFNAQDHVSVNIESLFDTLARGSDISACIASAFKELDQNRIRVVVPKSTLFKPISVLILQANNNIDLLLQFKTAFAKDFSNDWNCDRVFEANQTLRKDISSLQTLYYSTKRKGLTDIEKEQLDSFNKSLQALSTVCYSLAEIFGDKAIKAEAEQCAFIYGSAGAGKSHLLGQIATERVNKKLPTVLLLGQSFSDSSFWEQLGSTLELSVSSADEILGLLNMAGERVGERTLLFIDAINEGVGARYWRQNIIEILLKIKEFPYLALVLSCREEYLPYAIPDSLMSKLCKFEVKGFSTPDELERAAIRYLDSKGIARPNTPWLSPEFSNPLFLKTASEALFAKGKTEFPRGLTGISEVMALYLDALSWRVGSEIRNIVAIATSLKQCVSLIANNMVKNQCDYVELGSATATANESFQYREPPPGKTWLDVLTDLSLFRRDPPPYTKDIDPFNPPAERIRFAFQRFQDHLMAKALTDKLCSTQATSVFDVNGVLSFLFYECNSKYNIRYEYAGLVNSLSTIYPERFGLEFALTLPSWEKHWSEEQLIQEAFGESFKWRSASSFTEQTSTLLNKLDFSYLERWGLLLEVSITSEHPYNAHWLHNNLKKQKMPTRDSQWTRWINWSSQEEFSQINRVVSWALSATCDRADDKHIELASLVLVWALSSSHMTLRDRATKALTNLFLISNRIYQLILNNMCECDDPYIIERIFAAAYGACCIDQTSERLKVYSRITFDRVFADRNAPVGLLTRDYALGIIELSKFKNSLDNDICLDACYSPLGSNIPDLTITTDDVEKIAKQSGGKEIFSSASSEWGDYGKYSIPSRVNDFLKVPLDEPKPISSTERKNQFIEEMINPYPERLDALSEYNDACHKLSQSAFKSFESDYQKQASDDIEKLEIQKENTLKILLNLFDTQEKVRFNTDYISYSSAEEFIKIDVQQCRLWITKRAYQLGWNAELFPRDGHGGSYSRHENNLERIGKKYQRIALDELQARLADNYWILEGWPEQPSVYRYSHLSFRRNLEPTILPYDSSSQLPRQNSNEWMHKPIVELPEVAEENLKSWPFEENPVDKLEYQINRVDKHGKSWRVLYEYSGDTHKYSDPNFGEHGFRYEEFRFIYCVFLKQGMTGQFASFIESQQRLDGHHIGPKDYTDGPFLREAHWRETWYSEKFSESMYNAPSGCDFAIPIADYGWESHLDKSLPDGFSQYMPQKWFADELKIAMSDHQSNIWLDSEGDITLQASKAFTKNKVVVIDNDAFDSYLSKFEVEPVWLMIAERSHWPNGGNKGFSGRRAEGLLWREADSWKKVDWKKDTNR
jgi:hypothetical protein